MRKIGLDQTTAWIAAVLGTGALFGVGHLITKRVGRAGGTVAAHAPAASAHGQDHGERDEHDAAPAHEAAHPSSHDGGALGAKSAPTWDYRGSVGPEHWGSLADAYKSCGAGRAQSPIDIDAAATDAKLLPIRFHYKTSDVTVRHTGRTVQVDYPIGNYVEIDGDRYDLTRFELHAPSEHKVSGIPYDLEMQLVHRSAEGRLAVVSLLFEEGRDNAALHRIWAAMPAEPGAHPEPVAFDLSATLPRKRQFYRYAGSLTTPPCSEGVSWHVLVEPLEVSAKQVDAFVQLVKFNARPVQPLNGRRVSRSTR